MAAVMVPQAQGQTVVTDDITTDQTWTKENSPYILNGLVFVGEPTVDQDGNTQNLDQEVTLTIEPGVVVKARTSANVEAEGNQQREGASALIVRRSGKINADGEKEDGSIDPIIFTSEFDDIGDPDDMRDANSPLREQWGGVIILGEATTNQQDGSGNRLRNNQIEGIPQSNNTAQFGSGTAANADDMDNSGTFRYVSIRHAGFSISGDAGDEINGLTMGAVGRGTTIDHVEVYANFDDGFEWFGGTVHTSHLLAAYCGDDDFDYDQGFRGSGQYWASIKSRDRAGRGGEHDGNDAGGFDQAGFLSQPVISNVTYVGAGTEASVSGIGGDGNNAALQIRDESGGEYYNSIFTDFPGVAVNINQSDGTGDNVAGGGASGAEQDILFFENNAFTAFGAGDTFSDIVEANASEFENGFPISQPNGGSADGNVGPNTFDEVAVRDPGDRNPNSGTFVVDLRPTNAFVSAAPETDAPNQFVANAAANIGDGMSRSEYLQPFDDVDYHGAFDPDAVLDPSAGSNVSWIAGWTTISRNEVLLPVEMASFDATQNGDEVQLSWKTASEKNNAGFEVQRSVDGSAFQQVGFVEGSGTTSSAQRYSFTDGDVPFEASDVDYRLKQVDTDGSAEYSDVRTVTLQAPKTVEIVSTAPNPAGERARVLYQLPEQGKVELNVFNALGQRVAQVVNGVQTEGRKAQVIDTSDLSSGVYFVRLRAQGQTLTQRITVVK
jgi:hypothetical protein